ncbi:MAG: putative ferric reductase [Psychromonas sp.]|jgi:predicted ferric reductase|uniref:ferredoxin reductase family protein n=1 Tax=Psychromonas sp. TaxID=1884585 RepID=UPI0039E5922F
MNRIKMVIPMFFGLMTLLWLSAESFDTISWSYFPIRKVAIQYSGILAISTMSIIMLLALRLKPLEKFLNGLDKSYRLHKWLGIGTLVLVIIHWFWAKGTKYMVGLGLLDKPGGKGGMHVDLTGVEAIFRGQKHLAEFLGEWGFYLFLVLIVIALTKTIRYSKFLNTHKIMSLVYLVFVFHTIILTKFSYWQQPVGWLVGILIAAGSWAAIVSLLGKIGRKNKVQGSIEQFHFFEENQVLDITINTQKKWQGHNPGQFAFIKFAGEEPHPFTIASAQSENGGLRFQIKAIGDFTKRLKNSININDPVTVEGPYGYFNFKSETQRQIWVAGGIGIAAFTAQMEALAQTPEPMEVDLFYCTQCPDVDFIRYINQLADQANINLHLVNTNTDGFLTAKQISENVSFWKKADIWFCGPNNFAKKLQSDFAQLGLSASKFHHELFEMR